MFTIKAFKDHQGGPASVYASQSVHIKQFDETEGEGFMLSFVQVGDTYKTNILIAAAKDAAALKGPDCFYNGFSIENAAGTRVEHAAM